MGSSSSTAAPSCSEIGLSANLAQVHYDDGLWMASCRPNSRMNVFASHLFLFQPDCRLFCPNGLKCKLLQGTRGHIHRQLFIHTTKKIVMAAAEEDLASRNPSTMVMNAPELQVALPYVPQCWSMDAAHVEDLAVLPRNLSRRTVVIWIHGFRQRFFRVNSVAHHLLHLCRENLAQEEFPPLVISFLWPCHRRGLAYMRARDSAELAGQRLDFLVRTLQQLSCRIVIVAHSLGCRVALRALARGDGQDPIDSLIVLGAAVPSSSLSCGAEFVRSSIAARNIVVCHSVHDEVLSSLFSMGEVASSWMHGQPTFRRQSAMGLVGVDDPIPDNTRTIDVSSTVPNHTPNFWLMSPDVMQHIMAALSTCVVSNDVSFAHHLASSETAAHSWTSADIPQCGEPWSDLIPTDIQGGDEWSDNDSDESGLVYHI